MEERCAAAYVLVIEASPDSGRARSFRGPASTRVLGFAEARRLTLLLLTLIPSRSRAPPCLRYHGNNICVLWRGI